MSGLEFEFTTRNGIRVIITRRDPLLESPHTKIEFSVALEEDAEATIGGLMLYLPFPGNRKKVGIIKRIQVDESYRWQGIGKKLFGMAIDMIDAMKLKDIECEANTDLEKGFYMSMHGIPQQSPRGVWPVLFKWDMRRNRPVTIH